MARASGNSLVNPLAGRFTMVRAVLRLLKQQALVLLAVAVLETAQGQTPIPAWATDASKFQLLPGEEVIAEISPCLAFKANTNMTVDVVPIQCAANPMYLLAQAYQWTKNASSKPPTPGTLVLWKNNTPIQPPVADFKTTIARKALFRVAQKQHWCQHYTSQEDCTADTRTPCAFVKDDAVTDSLGLSRSNSSCVYYTQPSFFRQLIWEMFQLENQTSSEVTLAGALNCLWPPFKRQAVTCDSDKVEKFCQKLPTWCKPLVDTFRFSCQAAEALDQWRKSSQYTHDDFNATQNMYRSAMHRLYAAAVLKDVYQSSWGNSYTSWLLYQFTGSRKSMESWMSDTAGMTAGTTYPSSFVPAAACSKFKSATECVNADVASTPAPGRFADSTYCSWSREQLVPGMSNADNKDYPKRGCQLSTRARVEAAVLLDGTRGSNAPSGYLKPQQDLLSFLYDNLFYTDAAHKPDSAANTFCGDPYDCTVEPRPMVFPAWQPSGQRGSADDCSAALDETWEV